MLAWRGEILHAPRRSKMRGLGMLVGVAVLLASAAPAHPQDRAARKEIVVGLAA
jgi:hypothetical protein